MILYILNINQKYESDSDEDNKDNILAKELMTELAEDFVDLIEDSDDELNETEDKIELNSIITSFKRALTINVADRRKEEEKLQKIEEEQKSIILNDSVIGKKTQCIKILGDLVYKQVYNYMQNANTKQLNYKTIAKDVSEIVGKDKEKMNATFVVKQIAEIECNQTFH